VKNAIFLLFFGVVSLNAENLIHSLSAQMREKMIGVSYHQGCPVPLDDLRVVDVTYIGFDKHAHKGQIVVHKGAAEDVAHIFDMLHASSYPIKSIIPIESFQGSDWRSIEADNTSAFNCRNATGEKSWSKHAYGLAIDINPIENPYVFRSGKTSHKSSVPYLDRNNHNLTHSDAIITKNSKIYKIFQKYGWKWGGEWGVAKDYQHFYKQ
jgi:hypothetical protein